MRITHPRPALGRQKFIGVTFVDGVAEVDELHPETEAALLQHGYTIEGETTGNGSPDADSKQKRSRRRKDADAEMEAAIAVGESLGSEFVAGAWNSKHSEPHTVED